MQLDEQQLVSVFEERAENLTQAELSQWTYLSAAEKHIVSKLTGPGAKLLSGPRGSGKSTLLRRAYYELIASHAALPIYVNYSKALALEPLFHSRANALELFRQWLTAKLIVGVRESLVDLDRPPTPEQLALFQEKTAFIRALEVGSAPDAIDNQIGPAALLELLERWTDELGHKRCVLLLDDAAHAFSFRQQQEFFEVFRELRSRRVSAKAAIYPGTTSFSPNFNVGHEAETLEAWFRPDSESYIATMSEIAHMRIPEALLQKLDPNRQECLELLALAAFGLPRGFLNMLSYVVDIPTTTQPNLRKAITDAISAHVASTRTVFSNIADKLPRFSGFIRTGTDLEVQTLAALRAFNRDKPLHAKATTLALSAPIPAELNRVLSFLEYAGLFRRLASLSKGVKGAYERYLVNYASIVSTNALAIGRSFSFADIIVSLRKSPAHALVKVKPVSLLGSDYQARCTLALPPCPKCNTPRLKDDQRFCMTCGTELANASIYLELLKTPIERLPLPQAKIAAIRANTAFRTVQDLLTDDEIAIRVPGSYIGKVWAKRIRNVAEEFVSV